MLTSEEVEYAQRTGKPIRFMTDAQIVVLLLGLILPIPIGIALFLFFTQ